MSRSIGHRYTDPLDLIWLKLAAELGFTIHRSDEAYASWDGQRTLTICTPEHFDADDSLGQFIFHEVCHALVQGPEHRRSVDWGLHETEDVAILEHSCHRLQAALADRYGLREFFAVTTDWREYWDALPSDPLRAGDDPAIGLAREGWERARHGEWRDPLQRALKATADLAKVVTAFATDGDLWSRVRPLHPLGFPLHGGEERCGTCAWQFVGGRGHGVSRCRRCASDTGSAPRIATDSPACDRWEPKLTDQSCGSCGACCRGGFHLVPVSAREPLVRAHPELLVTDRYGRHLPRPDGHCVALRGGRGEAYRCSVYALRPRGCRDLEIGGVHCLAARQRTGLTR